MGVYSICGNCAISLSQMIIPISLGSQYRDLQDEVRIRRRALRRRSRKLRWQVRRAIRAQRENAVINYLSAKRFPSTSKEARILRLLAQSNVQRLKRLEEVLDHSPDADHTQRRRLSFDWRCFCVAHAPRLVLLLWLKHHKD